MTHVTPAPQPEDPAFTLGMSVGSALAVEMVNTFGPRRALNALGDNIHTTFTDEELGILASAVALILARRESAPDDLSALGHVELTPCSDVACGICGGAR